MISVDTNVLVYATAARADDRVSRAGTCWRAMRVFCRNRNLLIDAAVCLHRMHDGNASNHAIAGTMSVRPKSTPMNNSD